MLYLLTVFFSGCNFEVITIVLVGEILGIVREGFHLDLGDGPRE
jgi:hypothetical protein